jgi:hypothetical protein
MQNICSLFMGTSFKQCTCQYARGRLGAWDSGPGVWCPIAELIRIQLVLSGTQNRTFGSYLAATHRALIPVMHAPALRARLLGCVAAGIPDPVPCCLGVAALGKP